MSLNRRKSRQAMDLSENQMFELPPRNNRPARDMAEVQDNNHTRRLSRLSLSLTDDTFTHERDSEALITEPRIQSHGRLSTASGHRLSHAHVQQQPNNKVDNAEFMSSGNAMYKDNEGHRSYLARQRSENYNTQELDETALTEAALKAIESIELENEITEQNPKSDDAGDFLDLPYSPRRRRDPPVFRMQPYKKTLGEAEGERVTKRVDLGSNDNDVHQTTEKSLKEQRHMDVSVSKITGSALSQEEPLSVLKAFSRPARKSNIFQPSFVVDPVVTPSSRNSSSSNTAASLTGPWHTNLPFDEASLDIPSKSMKAPQGPENIVVTAKLRNIATPAVQKTHLVPQQGTPMTGKSKVLLTPVVILNHSGIKRKDTLKGRSSSQKIESVQGDTLSSHGVLRRSHQFIPPSQLQPVPQQQLEDSSFFDSDVPGRRSMDPTSLRARLGYVPTDETLREAEELERFTRRRLSAGLSHTGTADEVSEHNESIFSQIHTQTTPARNTNLNAVSTAIPGAGQFARLSFASSSIEGVVGVEITPYKSQSQRRPFHSLDLPSAVEMVQPHSRPSLSFSQVSAARADTLAEVESQSSGEGSVLPAEDESDPLAWLDDLDNSVLVPSPSRAQESRKSLTSKRLAAASKTFSSMHHSTSSSGSNQASATQSKPSGGLSTISPAKAPSIQSSTHLLAPRTNIRRQTPVATGKKTSKGSSVLHPFTPDRSFQSNSQRSKTPAQILR